MNKNEGSIMIDFIFGMTVTAGVSFILLALCFTMAMVEVSQYIAFASSRAYFSGHLDVAKQEERGKEKFEKLMTLRPFKVMLKDSSWFKLTFINSTDFTGEYDIIKDHDNETFFGTQLKFKADVLDLQLPLLDRTSGAFDAVITSYLGREPTTFECIEDFEKKRWEQFMIRAGFAQPPGTNPSADYAVITDNGC